MIRSLFTVAAALSFAMIVSMSAGYLQAHSRGYAQIAHVGVWYAWIDDADLGWVGLADSNPLSSSLTQSSTVFVRAPLLYVTGPPVICVIAWGVFTFRRLQRSRQGRGFAVEPRRAASMRED